MEGKPPGRFDRKLGAVQAQFGTVVVYRQPPDFGGFWAEDTENQGACGRASGGTPVDAIAAYAERLLARFDLMAEIVEDLGLLGVL